MDHKPGAMIVLQDEYERMALSTALEDIGFQTFTRANAVQGAELFRRLSFDVSLVIFDADQGFGLPDTVSKFIAARGYQHRPHLLALSASIHDAPLDNELRTRQAEFCSKADTVALLRRAKGLFRKFTEIKRPEFRMIHTIGQPYLGLCLAGEIFNKLSVRTPVIKARANVSAGAKPLLFLDAIFRYSTEEQPLTLDALLRHMELNPVYLNAIREESLNKRNLMTNFFRIKEDCLRPVLGAETDECVVSERVPGREYVYYFRADFFVNHLEITPPDEAV